jgi:cell division transport system ATP-binding protein
VDQSGTTILQLEQVGLGYGGAADVLHDIDLQLAAGSFHFLMGPSGAGKTSLLRLLSLTQPPSRGRFVLFGREVAQLDRAQSTVLRKRIGVVFQDLRLLDHLSAFDNVALPLWLGGAADEQVSTHVADLLAWLGLGEAMERKPPELSMGQRQLVAVGRAVVGRPSLLLADEPTSNVDPVRARRLLHLLLSLHRLGTAVLFATHHERLPREYGFPVLQIAGGRLTGQRVLPAPVPLSP